MSKLDKIIKYAIRFTNIDYAKDFIKDAKKCLVISQGNDGYYWITTLAEAMILYKNGYEIIK